MEAADILGDLALHIAIHDEMSARGQRADFSEVADVTERDIREALAECRFPVRVEESRP